MLNELEHYYGPHVHLVNSPLLQGFLGELCSPETTQPRIGQLIRLLYKQICFQVVEKEFALEAFASDSRMTAAHPSAKVHGTRVASSQRAISVAIARAGLEPSSVCYNLLHQILKPEGIRQDFIFASRNTNESHQVTGATISGHKTEGGKNGSIVLFPDPMGATGSTLATAVDHYKKNVPGTWIRPIAIHLIVTPEYLRFIQSKHPDLVIYAIRLDRGLSSQAILDSPLGLHWDQEKGLNENDYIIPGGGGFGEIINNSFS